MRWPLKNQILVRLLLLILVTVVAMTIAFIRSSVTANQQLFQQRVSDISEFLANARFPLNATVLDQMQKLSGAEFIVVDAKGLRLANSTGAPEFPVGELVPSASSTDETMNESIIIHGESWFHTTVKIPPRENTPISASNLPAAIHVLVSRDDYNVIWWRSVVPPLMIAAVIIPLAIFLSLAISGNVTRPMARLRKQVGMIAGGDFQQLPDTDRNDEIGDLSTSINLMAGKLVDHDRQIRQNERLETLVLMSSGVAHNLRNSVTGCKMAVDLLAQKLTGEESNEEIQVAQRQLERMRHYVDRFLSLARSNSNVPDLPTGPVNLVEVLHSVSRLTGPHAKHLNVQFESTCSEEVVNFVLGRTEAEQVMTNLINNAIDAASESASREFATRPFVHAKLTVDENGRIDFTVTDSGDGPPTGISETLFLPFVTGKRGGTGLGLSLVNDIANRIGGKLDWCRDGNQTRFVFTFGFGDKPQN